MKNEMNFEINLLPVISLLAVLICFLLLTTAWVQIGTFDIAQAFGGQSQEETKKQPTLNVFIETPQKIKIQAENKDGKIVKSFDSNVSDFEKHLVAFLQDQENVYTVGIVTPSKSIELKNLIFVMDVLRSNKVKELGVSPL
jgi:biopolymer transport protein ExbD